MSYTITNQCIGCTRCVSGCPTGAVQQSGDRFWIDTQLCNGCQGQYSVPQCVAVCPTNGGCIPDVQEFWERWFAKYNRIVSRLHQADQSTYWDQWFDKYSQRLAPHLHLRRSGG